MEGTSVYIEFTGPEGEKIKINPMNDDGTILRQLNPGSLNRNIKKEVQYPSATFTIGSGNVIGHVGTNNGTIRMHTYSELGKSTGSKSSTNAHINIKLKKKNYKIPEINIDEKLKEFIKSDRKKDKSRGDKECIICTENAVQIRIEPCGHTNSCATCMSKLKNKTCPSCRKKIIDVQRVIL